MTSPDESMENFCLDFTVRESEHGCYSVSNITNTDIIVDFNFDMADENCLGGSEIDSEMVSTDIVSTTIDHNSFMEINLHLPLIKSVTLNQPFLSTNNSSTADHEMKLEYTQDWSQTYTCAKCK